MKKLVVVLLMILSMALTACAGVPKAVESSEAVGAEKDSVVVSMRADAVNLDPQGHTDLYSFIPDAQVFDTLLYMDENGDYQNLLAESIEPSEDGTIARVTIKKDVKFSNGEDLKASDVKFSFDRGITSSTYGRITAVDHVDLVDDYTVDVFFTEPTAYMEQTLSAIFVVNEKEVTRVGDDFGNSIDGVIGTGAYKITSWDKGQSMTFESNEDYWQGAPAVKNLSVKIIADQTTAGLALKKGEVDYIFEAEASLDRTLAEDPNVETYSTVQNANMFVMMNCSAAPFDDVNVRQAVAYAVNRNDIATVSTDGHGIPTGYFVMDTMLDQAEGVCLPDQDMEKAKECMANSAYPDGVEVTFITNDTETEKIGTVVQAELAEIGIKVQLQAMEFGAAMDMYLNGDYQISSTGFINMISPDYYYRWLHSESGMSVFWYTSDKLDQLLEAGRADLNPDSRHATYTELQELMRDEVIYIPLYGVQQYVFANKALSGVKIFPVMVPQFRELSWQ